MKRMLLALLIVLALVGGCQSAATPEPTAAPSPVDLPATVVILPTPTPVPPPPTPTPVPKPTDTPLPEPTATPEAGEEPTATPEQAEPTATEVPEPSVPDVMVQIPAGICTMTSGTLGSGTSVAVGSACSGVAVGSSPASGVAVGSGRGVSVGLGTGVGVGGGGTGVGVGKITTVAGRSTGLGAAVGSGVAADWQPPTRAKTISRASSIRFMTSLSFFFSKVSCRGASRGPACADEVQRRGRTRCPGYARLYPQMLQETKRVNPITRTTPGLGTSPRTSAVRHRSHG